MECICPKCNKEFEIDDPTFIAYYNRNEKIYCEDCLLKDWKLGVCINCKHRKEYDLYDEGWSKCLLHINYTLLYCIEKVSKENAEISM